MSAYSEFKYPEEIVRSTGLTDFQVMEVQPEDITSSLKDRESAVKDEDPPVYPSCPLRLSKSVLLIMTLAIRHNLTGDALADVIKLIDLHCVPGSNSHSVKTLRELKSYFSNSKEALELFYYCKCCYSLLSTEQACVCKRSHGESCFSCGVKLYLAARLYFHVNKVNFISKVVISDL